MNNGVREIKNSLEIYKVLPGTNCGQCGVPSCMAFAVSVFQGTKALPGCPYLDKSVIERLSPGIARHSTRDDEYKELITLLRQEVQLLDFTSVAPRIGADLINNKLAINCLGRNFFIDQAGNMTSSCHVNHWVYVPLLQYILKCQGREPGNNWVAFGELPGAAKWNQYFAHRCEEALRHLTDAHLELVLEMCFLFGAVPAPATGGANHSLTVLPLPKVPFLINYWSPEDGFPSKINILLDRSAAYNIIPHSITLLARGIIEMFRQLIVSHSREGKLF
jgi:hypothetical protein